MKTIQEKLGSHPFLKGMRPEYLEIIASHAKEAEFKSDQIIFREGETAYQCHLILEGKVSVESHVSGTDRMPLQILSAGDVLGWSWLFPPFVWHFHARALEPTKVIVLDGARLLVASEDAHSFGFELMQRIAQIVIRRVAAAQARLFEVQKLAGRLPPVDEGRGPELPRGSVAQSPADMIAEHPFFKGMKEEHLAILANAAMKSGFEKGQTILRKGDPANRFYLVQHGKIVVEALDSEDTPMPIQIIKDGDVLGWSWFFPPFYFHFDARALEPTECVFLYATRLREECERNHELGHALMKRTVALIIRCLQATRLRLLEFRSHQKVGLLAPIEEDNLRPARAAE